MFVALALLACAAPTFPVAPPPREVHRWATALTLKHPRPVVAVAASADRIATADEAGAVVLWDAKTGERLQTLIDDKAKAAPVTRLRFSPDGAWLHIISHDGARIHVCECRKPKQTQVFASAPLAGPWRALDVASGTPLWIVSAYNTSLWWYRVSTDATAPFGRQDDPFAPDRRAHADRITHLAATDGVLVTLSGGVLRGRFADRDAKPWRVSVLGVEPTALALSANGERVAVVGDEGWVRVFNAANGQQAPRPAGHTREVWGAAFAPDGGYLVTASADRTARVWAPVTGAELAVLTGHTAGVRAVAVAPDGKRIVTGSEDGTARVWARK
jgi:WD40 repeat protein